MKKAPVLLALVLLVLPLYAVLIELSSDNIDRIGGTGRVTVSGPGIIHKVKWTLTKEPPYQVGDVTILWKAEDVNSKYTVYVTIYDNSDNIKGYGSTGGQGGGGEITTTINLNTYVDPKEIYKVEIIIVEE